MAGNYFYDPRPFYPVFYSPNDRKLVPLSELFNEKKDSKGSEAKKEETKKEKKEEAKPKTVELKVSLCCDYCENKVLAVLEDMDGVEKVKCDQWTKKVIVTGDVKPERVLERVRRVKKDSEFWPKKKN